MQPLIGPAWICVTCIISLCVICAQIDESDDVHVSDPYVQLRFTGNTKKGDYKVQSTKVLLSSFVYIPIFLQCHVITNLSRKHYKENQSLLL